MRLVPALLFCSFVSLSDASCFFQDLETDGRLCKDKDGVWHKVGTTWISDCMRCTCTQCCSTYSQPTYFPDDCIAVFDKVACEYIVHKKDDPSVKCPIFAAVG